MKKMTNLVIIALGVSVSACGAEIIPEEPMTSEVTSLYRELGELEELSMTHGTTMDGLDTLEAMGPQEADYAGTMADRHAEMAGALSEMGECRYMGEGPHTQDALPAVDSLLAEGKRHTENMGQAVDLSAARAEESRHQVEMVALIANLRDHKSELETDADKFMCPMDSHGTDTENSNSGGH